MGRQADSRLRNAGEAAPQVAQTVDGQAVWRGYVNVALTADQKSQFDDWTKTDDPLLALEESVAGGSQLGLKYVGKEKTFLASLTNRQPGHVNCGLCVTARSSSAIVALMRVLFLYRVLGGENSWESVQRVADPDRW